MVQLAPEQRQQLSIGLGLWQTTKRSLVKAATTATRICVLAGPNLSSSLSLSLCPTLVSDDQGRRSLALCFCAPSLIPNFRLHMATFAHSLSLAPRVKAILPNLLLSLSGIIADQLLALSLLLAVPLPLSHCSSAIKSFELLTAAARAPFFCCSYISKKKKKVHQSVIFILPSVRL